MLCIMMFRLFLILSFTFGFINCEIFRDDRRMCNDSNSEKDSALRNCLPKVQETQNLDFNYQYTNYSREFFFGSHKLSWWTDFPVLPLVFATSDTLPEGRCKKQTQRFLQNLENSTLWAVQMFDASTKYPDGIIYGHTKHLGNFDECYNLRAKLLPDEENPEYDDIEGRYCLVRFRYQRMDVVPTRPNFFTLDFEPDFSAWNALDEKGDFRRVKRNLIHTALCVPASCSPEEIETALSHPLKKFAESRGLRLDTTVNPSYCQARRDVPESFTTGTKIFCSIIVVILVLAVGSSWYDNSLYSSEEAANDHGSKDFFLCFSLRRNFRSIFSEPGTHPGLNSIHLIRFFFMTGVIIGHRMMQYYGYPMIDSTYLEKAYGVPSSMMLFNGPIVTDGFFSIGGLLLAYGLLEELDRRKRPNFVAFVLIRFLRLTPLYMLVVFFHATLFPYMGSGPYWKINIEQERDYCASNWWTNLFYINNYVNPEKMCMFQSWYLSVDYHLYILGLITLSIFWRLPRRLGYIFLSGLIALGVGIPFSITYAKNLQPMLLGLPFMRDIRKDPYFIDHYIKSHMRIGPYMVGVLAGAIVYDHKNASWRLPKAWSRLLFILFAVGFSITSQSLGAKYFDPNSKLDPFETAIYAGLHRTAFAFGICSIVVLISIGDGLDFHYNFMNPKWVPPLARLTYGAFLVHNINQAYEIGTTRTPRVFSLHNMFWDLVPDLVYTFGLSLLLSVAVEGPIRRFEKYMLTKRLDKSLTETSSRSSVNDMKKTK